MRAELPCIWSTASFRHEGVVLNPEELLLIYRFLVLFFFMKCSVKWILLVKVFSWKPSFHWESFISTLGILVEVERMEFLKKHFKKKKRGRKGREWQLLTDKIKPKCTCLYIALLRWDMDKCKVLIAFKICDDSSDVLEIPFFEFALQFNWMQSVFSFSPVLLPSLL